MDPSMLVLTCWAYWLELLVAMPRIVSHLELLHPHGIEFEFHVKFTKQACSRPQ